MFNGNCELDYFLETGIIYNINNKYGNRVQF